MTAFKPGVIARVPFPYTDRATLQHRPAVVISARTLGSSPGMLWLVMITSADNRAWPGDVSLEEGHIAMGLPAPSLARTVKVAAIDVTLADVRGQVPPAKLVEIMAQVRGHLGVEQA